MSAGTAGNGSERYSIYLPFELPIGRELKVKAGGSAVTIFGQQYAIERLHHRYAIHGGEFSSRDEAEAFLFSMRSSLMWYSLTHRLGIRYPTSITECRLYDEPIKISLDNKFSSLLAKQGWTVTHGDYDADQAVVKPEHLCLTRWESGQVSIKTDISLDRFVSAVEEAHQMPKLTNLRDNPRICLAIEIYTSALFQSSNQAQLLILVSALEATLVPQTVEAPIAEAIQAAANAARSKLESIDSEDLSPIVKTQLADRILSLKQVSIAQQFRDQILTHAKHLEPWSTSGTLEKELKSTYNTRSRLVHDGTVDQEQLKSGLAFLREFVPAYLTKEYRRAVSNNGDGIN